MKTILTLVRDFIILICLSISILALIIGCLVTGGIFNNYFYDKFIDLYNCVERIIGE